MNIATVQMIQNIIDGTTPIKSTALGSTVFPVGTIVHRYDDVDPAELYGGTWERIRGRFLLAQGGYLLGAEGGEEQVSLTEAQNGQHAHNYYPYSSDQTVGYEFQATVGAWSNIDNHATKPGSQWTRYGGYSNAGVMTQSGGGEPHNNMPPYIVVGVWRRIE